MSYPWIKDSQYVDPLVTGYLAVTSPNGLYLTDGASPATIITPTSVTSTTFYGTLNGTVSNATNATNATNVAITDDGTTNAAFYPVFVSNNSGNLALKVDKTTTPLSYNPSTGEFLSQSFAATITNGTVFSRLSSTQLQVASVPSNIVTVTSNQITVFTSGTGTTTITPASVTSASFVGALTGNATTATTATNIAGGAAGRISYQTGAGTTAFVAVGNGGQFLQANGPAAPTWVNQNLAATVSLSPTSFPTSGSAILTANFNSSYSSVTRYPVTLTNSNGSITINVNTYTLSGGLSGGQYTIVLEITMAGNAGTTLNFNGTGTASGAKFNFIRITNTYGGTTETKYVVLTFAYDGSNYYLSGSNFT
jgi:hypothetical protein